MEFGYDTAGRIEVVREARCWGSLFDNFDAAGLVGGVQVATTLEDVEAVTYKPGDRRIDVLNYVQLGGRTFGFTYDQAPTRQPGPGIVLSRTTRQDASGGKVHFEFEVESGRVWREEIEPSDDVVGRPRAHDPDKASLGANFREEPTLIRIDYTFDSSCSCGKPIRVETTGFVPGQTPVTRTFEYEYFPGTRLLKTRTVPNPSTSVGAPPTVATTYTYESEQSSSEWSAYRIKTITTPDGVIEFDYVWRSRLNLAGHGKSPERITRTIADVRLQTDFGTTTTTSIASSADLGYVGSYPPQHRPSRLNGQPAILTDGDGVVTTLDYDDFGGLTYVSSGGVDVELHRNKWGKLTSIDLNKTATNPAHQMSAAISQGAFGEMLGSIATVDGVTIESQLMFDRWGNLAVVRRRNEASDGSQPHEFGVAPGSARDWVEEQYLYQWKELVRHYRDRRALNLPAGAPFDSNDALAWFLVTDFERRADGRLHRVTQPNGAVTEYQIDGFGSLYTSDTTAGADAFQGPRRFVNALLEEIATFEGGAGQADPKLWTVIARNDAGAVISVTEPVLAQSLVPAGYTGSLGGAVHAYEIDVMGRTVRSTSGTGSLVLLDVSRDFDQLGRLMLEERRVLMPDGTEPPGGKLQRMWAYVAGKEGWLGFEKETGASQDILRQFAYDSASGRVLSFVDGAGNSAVLQYHAGTEFVYSATQHLVDGTGGAAVDYRTEYGVDALGRVTVLKEMGDGTVAQGEELVHQFFYNSLGYTDRYIDPLGSEEVYLPDALGRLYEHVRVGLSAAAPNPRNVHVYVDSSGGGVSEVHRDDGLGNRTSTRYDYLGRPKSVRLPGSAMFPDAGNKHVPFSYFCEYDILSRLKNVYDGNGGNIRFWYNGPGHLIQREVLNANGSQLISNFNVRDLLNRDVLGRIANTGSFAVNESGIYSITALEAFTQDSLGRVHSEAFLPYGLGNIVEVKSAFDMPAGFRTGLSYLDNLGASSKAIHLDYSPNSVGRLWKIGLNQVASGSGSSSQLAEYLYRGSQKRYRKTSLGTGHVESHFEYDAFGRLEEISDVLNGGAAPFSQFNYVYDKASSLLKEEYATQGGREGDRFAYDEFQRLTVSWLGVDQNTMSMPLQDLIAGTGNPVFVKKLTYGLDDANNRTSVADSGTGTTDPYVVQDAAHPQGPSNRYEQAGVVAPEYDSRGNTRFDGQRYYVYDYLNRLSEVYYITPAGSSSNQQSLGTSATYGVTDVRVLERARGSILRRVGFDVRQLMSQMRDPAVRERLRESVQGGVIELRRGGGAYSLPLVTEAEMTLVAVYNYDAFNRRTARIIVGIGTYAYAWDGWQEAQELGWNASAGSVPLQQYVWGESLNELVAYRNVSGTPTLHYMSHGGQDTPSRLLDANGAVVEQYEYDAYGRAATFNVGGGNYLNPLRWKGMRVDPETGLGYMRNRYYSFEWGRFLTEDPLGLWADRLNWGNGAAYVGNNPLTRWDRLGLQGQPEGAPGATTSGSHDGFFGSILGGLGSVVGGAIGLGVGIPDALIGGLQGKNIGSSLEDSIRTGAGVGEGAAGAVGDLADAVTLPAQAAVMNLGEGVAHVLGGEFGPGAFQAAYGANSAAALPLTIPMGIYYLLRDADPCVREIRSPSGATMARVALYDSRGQFGGGLHFPSSVFVYDVAMSELTEHEAGHAWQVVAFSAPGYLVLGCIDVILSGGDGTRYILDPLILEGWEIR